MQKAFAIHTMNKLSIANVLLQNKKLLNLLLFLRKGGIEKWQQMKHQTILAWR